MKVAVVDDDESFGRAIGRLLRASKLEPSVYTSAEDFLEDDARLATDCLVLDINLGGMSGLDLQRRLAAQGSTTPIIFVTADDTPTYRTEAQQLGCAAYLRKPVPGSLLLGAIARVLGKKNS